MGRNELAALIAHNPVNRSLDTRFVDGVMRDAAVRHMPELRAIQSMKRIKYKRRVGEYNSTFIYLYLITGVNRKGEPVRKRLVYSAHSDDSRLRAYTVLQMLIRAGFNDDPIYKTIVPLEYLPEVKALLYEAVPGRTLWDFMKQCVPARDIYPVLSLVAGWIRKLHTFTLLPTELAQIQRVDVLQTYWRPDEVLAVVKEKNRYQADKLQAFYDALGKLAHHLTPSVAPGLVYGDPHPENIIVKNLRVKNLTMIDFTDVAIGDQLRDCGIFIQQLSFMGRNYYSHRELEWLRTYFIEHYFKKSMAELHPGELQRLNLYQAWNALRSFVYFFYQEKMREQSYGLLEDAWLYLTLAQQNARRITIYE